MTFGGTYEPQRNFSVLHTTFTLVRDIASNSILACSTSYCLSNERSDDENLPHSQGHHRPQHPSSQRERLTDTYWVFGGLHAMSTNPDKRMPVCPPILKDSRRKLKMTIECDMQVLTCTSSHMTSPKKSSST